MKLLILLSLLMFTAFAEARTLTVDPGGSGDSKTISGAISMAQPGDEILLKPATYDGAIVDRTLSISGSRGAKIVGQRGSALIVTAPGCKISNLSIEAGGSSPVIVLQSPDNIISVCKVTGGSQGINIVGRNNTLQTCEVQSGIGVEITSAMCKALNSTFRGDVGIRLKNTTANDIRECRLLSATGIEVSFSSGNRLENNSLSGLGFGVSLTGSTGNWILGNGISGPYMSGIDVLTSGENNLSGNHIEGSKLGISLRGSENNSLIENVCSKNERAGLYTDDSFRNEIRGNELSYNGNGILLANSGGNVLASNRAFLNTYGISLRGSLHNVLRNNSMQSNAYNLRVDSGEESSAEIAGSTREFFVQNIDSSNLVDGKPVCYLVGSRDIDVPQGCGFIGMIGCRNVSAVNQTISNSSAGILMVGSTLCRVDGCNISKSESGVYLLNSTRWTVRNSNASHCENGFTALASPEGRFDNDHAMSCSEMGFRADGVLNLTWNFSSANSCGVGISLLKSRLCNLLDCVASQNREAGIMLIDSHKCFLGHNVVTMNERGIALSGSNACIITENRAEANRQDGFSLEQLSSAELSKNSARQNGQGAFLHSSKKILVEGNNLSENDKYGLRMSASSECNATENRFIQNEISGANLVDCTGNFLYHNAFVENGFQNAVDNGVNHWDAGPKIGGNFWSDHQVEGNPGNNPREIPSKGLDRYPFQSQDGW
jgi:parallel beta-helix repeat protein